jgi:WD40 repeat protein
VYVKQVGDQENMELCDFSTDGKFVATVSPGSSEIILWNAEKALAEERTLSGHSKPVTALSFSSDGRFLVTAAQVSSLISRPPAPTLVKNPLSGEEPPAFTRGFTRSRPS